MHRVTTQLCTVHMCVVTTHANVCPNLIFRSIFLNENTLLLVLVLVYSLVPMLSGGRRASERGSLKVVIVGSLGVVVVNL